MVKRRSSLPAGSGRVRVRRRGFEAAVARDVEVHIAGRADHELAARRHGDRRGRLARSRPGASRPASPAAGRYSPAASPRRRCGNSPAPPRRASRRRRRCASSARRRRQRTSPTTRISTSARNAIGSRSGSRGGGQPALSLRAESSARSTWARHSACATGSCWLAAISSATAVAGRCVSPLLRSSRRKPSSTLGSRSMTSGAAATAATTTKTTDRWRAPAAAAPAIARPRKMPGTGRARSRGGERRPQPFPQQAAARALERPREQGPRRLLLLLRLLVQIVQKPLRRPGSGRIYCD